MKVLDRTLPALVVDDSRTMCEVMCRILRQAGFPDCHSSTEALDALGELKLRRYGLLMTDLNMNPISGTDLIRMIWADRDILPIPTILTSGNHQGIARAVVEAERELADVYILKPIFRRSARSQAERYVPRGHLTWSPPHARGQHDPDLRRSIMDYRLRRL